MYKIHVFIAFVLFFVSCAVQGPPSGGPEDKTSPAIVSVYPPRDTTNIATDTEIFIEFSEDVDKVSLESSLYVSPVFEEEFDFNWKGKKVFLIPPKELEENVTYVFTIGTDVKDLRNNQLTGSVSWAFSTGSEIDRGKISGKIIGDKQLSGCFVWCFKLNEEEKIDPRFSTPDYITQTDENGTFKSGNMSAGTYRVFVFKDADEDKRFTLSTELSGVPPGDVTISGDHFSELYMWITKQDTIPPAVDYIEVRDNHKIEMTFSEAVELPADTVFSLYDEEEKFLEIRDYYLKRNGTSAVFITDRQKKDELYHVRIAGLPDLWKNKLYEPGDSLTFLGTNVPDTIGPEVISFSPGDSSRNVPVTSPVEINFSETVDTSGFNNRTSFINISDTVDVQTEVRWISPVCVKIIPENMLQSMKTYLIRVDLTGLADANGNTCADSSFHIYFSSENTDNKGNITATLTDSAGSGDYRYILLLKNFNSGETVKKIKFENPGEFTLTNINSGHYSILIFKDLDGNGRYTFGKISPFSFSEPFIMTENPVEVRAGWDTALEELIFR